jgi:hypothetical protein
MGFLLLVHKQFHRFLSEQSLSQRHGSQGWKATSQRVKTAKHVHLRVQRA